jgi:predicted O-methyltransferase YrrM
MYKQLENIFNSLPAEKRYIQITKEQGEVLAKIIEKERPRLILEIGTAVGFSTACMALNLSNSARIVSIEKNLDHYLLAQKNLAKLPNIAQIDLLHGDALQILPNVLKKYKFFDLIFIDANKKAYTQYYQLCLPYLNNNGLIIADNVHSFAGVSLTKDPLPLRLRKLRDSIAAFCAAIQNNPLLQIESFEENYNMLIVRKRIIKS